MSLKKTASISDQARACIITANGIIIGFALNFFGSWCSSNEKWSKQDIPSLIIFIFGIFILAITLYRSLMPYDQSIIRYESNVKSLVLGIITIFIAVTLIVKQ
ncbi:hypothetical protein JD508_15315 [Aeromonas jandaei]|uniref:hypothetical protein n=1 Tax=Aeromonas jandaei TaxID=650 RepID=UPI00191F4C87|nr:hypothetical protein [Aeromonas jandaei]MBL0611608.1 hypothetical protein [Aeromonas jandaei]